MIGARGVGARHAEIAANDVQRVRHWSFEFEFECGKQRQLWWENYLGWVEEPELGCDSRGPT